MIDVSNIKAPGWQRVVGELAVQMPDDRIFLLRLLSTLGQVSGAKQAVLFTISGPAMERGPAEAKPALTWPFPADIVDAQGRLSLTPDQLMDGSRASPDTIDKFKDVQSAARAAGASRQVSVFSLEDTGGAFYDSGGSGGGQSGGSKWFVIAAPVLSGLAHEAPTLPLRGVITLLVESRSRQALQSVVALVEVLAGYVFTHEAQQALRRTKQASASLDLAARLIAAMNTAPNFKGCCIQLCNDLCRQLSADRVGLGWVQGSPALWAVSQSMGKQRPEKRELHLKALSDTENLDRRMELCRRIEAAMEECLDQEQTVLFPQPANAGPGSDAVLSQTITHAHRELAKGDATLRIASFPLRVVDGRGERIVGILLLESSGNTRLDVNATELVQATLDLITPVLAVRASDDRHLGLRTWDAMLHAAAWAVGPRHTAWKAAGVALMLATAVLFLGRTTYRVSAPFEMQADVRRVITAPINGVIASIPSTIEPGRDVTAGEVLVELDTREMRLQSTEMLARYTEAQAKADEALRKGDSASMRQFAAQAEQAKARYDLAELNIQRSRVTTPIDGTVIAGEIKDKIGAMVKVGDSLFEVADRRTMVVKARVEDRDISFIRPGQTGEVSPKANPALAVPFIVDQIVPLSTAVDGVNAYEVRGRFVDQQPADWFLPGLEGQAKFNTEKRSFAWIVSRRVVDQLRVWLWW
ncbi:MAG TPA: HlyD family efflux transporter periplasmic adaptor subunit [Phycisphaerales bacterium]|nr:HlyD family efflux transporter periplasmic adaptor subunit [Phycisphaerales bacterium]